MRAAWWVLGWAALGLLFGPGAIHAAPAPKLVCDAREYNFGDRDDREDVEHTFRLRNEGTAMLRIRRLNTDCGCLRMRLSTHRLEPGTEAELTVRFVVRDRRGPQSWEIVIESDDPQNPKMSVRLVGTITPSVELQPDMLFWGLLLEGTAVTSKVDLVAHGTNDFGTIHIESLSPLIVADAKVLEPGRRAQLTVRTAGALPRGVIEGAVLIQTEHPRTSNLLLRVSAQVSGPLTVAPEAIWIEAPGPSPVIRPILVRSLLETPLKILLVEPPVKAMRAMVLPFGRNGFRIQLEIPEATPDLEGQSVRIITNLPEASDVRVPIRYRVAPPRELSSP